MARSPTTLAELFQFYHEYVKLLYAEIQTNNKLPDATLFEINAALDHLSRHWVYQQTEADVVRHASSHLKRSCLDIFRLKVKQARDEYDELRAIDTSVIDNGDYDRSLTALMSQIKREATDARRLEGQHIEDIDRAFARWESVYELCARLHDEFFLHPRLEWAKKRQRRFSMREMFFGALISWIVGVLTPSATGLFGGIGKAWTWLAEWWRR